jgi:mRNA-degrading endonuclease RelE of RelBE toxin-antitoxin system
VADQPYLIRFKRSAIRDVSHLEPALRLRLRAAIAQRLAADPRHGKRLVGLWDEHTGRPLWGFRVGDHRVIYVFSDAEVWVLVVRIGPRGKVYRGL